MILSGGPASVHAADTPRAPDELFEMNLPVLGICYGEQVMCRQLGGDVESSDKREFGRAFLEVVKESLLFEDIWTEGNRYQVSEKHRLKKLTTTLAMAKSYVGFRGAWIRQ